MLPSLLLLAALAQPNPAEQIRYLMYESPRPEKHGSIGGTFPVFSCGPANGEATDNRTLANCVCTDKLAMCPLGLVSDQQRLGYMAELGDPC